ncbi:hypothetical protein GCM10009104_21020 [Marinobacterium maritimum]|uniref:Initiation factor 2B n=2 Tax=Marinobacterium maritimum TaxID=500162 RepID=A0ABP3T9R7_9GAMM
MDHHALTSLLRRDTTSGSTALTLRLLQTLRKQLRADQTLSSRILDQLVSELSAIRPSMVVLANVLHRWQHRLADCPTAELYAQALNSLDQLESCLKSASTRLQTQARQLVHPGMTLLLHSRSSAISQLLIELAADNIAFDVILTQSLPGREGALLAQELQAAGIPCQRIHDAQLMLFMEQADLCLSGCDAWLSDGYFINKCGTALQALAARQCNIPFWVLADSFKESPLQHTAFPLEILPGEGDMTISRIAFEPIPTSWASGRITEHGLQSA